jgi:hypothetical protein
MPLEDEEGKNPPNHGGKSVRADGEVKLSRVIPRRICEAGVVRRSTLRFPLRLAQRSHERKIFEVSAIAD